MGSKNVGPVIQEVLKLADRKQSKISSHGLLQQLVMESRSVSQAQLAEAATSESASTTLHYDGTTAAGQKYHSFQVTTQDDTYTLSVSDVASGSAEHNSCYDTVAQGRSEPVRYNTLVLPLACITAAGEKLV